MPPVSQWIANRQRRRQRAAASPSGRLALVFSILISLLVALGSLALAQAYRAFMQDAPLVTTLPGLLDPPQGALLQPTRLLDRSGETTLLVLKNPAASQAGYLPLSTLPGGLISATLTASDPDFWQHPGFSLAGVIPGGQSTLAQQLVSDLLLWDEPAGLSREVRARLLAVQATQRFGREQILEWYLNSANYGRLAYGIDAAARVYFGKSATQLDLAEAVLLAATAQAPALNPLDAPQAAIERQKRLLQQMMELRLVEPAEAARAAAEKLVFQPAGPVMESLAPAFTNLVLEQLQAHIPRQRLEHGGLQVITSLDADLQAQSACVLALQLQRLQRLAEDPALTGCSAARRLPPLPSLSGTPPSGLVANSIVLDPQTGQVLTLVGDLAAGQDPVRLPGHPPGTLLTPFIYLTAFTRGFGPASLLWDLPPGQAGGVANVDGRYRGPLRLRLAAAGDALPPAARLLGQVGAENAWRTAHQAGLVSLGAPPTTHAERLLQGGGEITLLEAVQAFGMLANGGVLVGDYASKEDSARLSLERISPRTVLRVGETDGNLLWQPDAPRLRGVVSPQLAYLITDVFSDEAARWPVYGHPNVLETDRPAAVKVGRTASARDVWVVGYTPQRVIGVWFGPAGVPQEESNEVSATPPVTATAEISATNTTTSTLLFPRTANGAAGAWQAILQYAHRDLTAQSWSFPSGVSRVAVCDPSGMLPTADCPNVVNEFFLAGSEPTQVDNLYQRIQINRESGLLATVFTPPDLIEEKVYLVLPPDARDWADRAGLAVPPTTYDVVGSRAQNDRSSEVLISSPNPYAAVRGTIQITGSAAGKDFSAYRLQVGKGLNPQSWLQVGEDHTQTVREGTLAEWDTAGLNGLYTIQLQVIRTDQRVDTAAIQVTVDNQPPQLEVQYPTEQQTVVPNADGAVTFQLSAQDDLALQQVEIFVDNALINTLIAPPYAFPWPASPGAHTLRLRASDTAGNIAEVTIHFTVK